MNLKELRKYKRLTQKEVSLLTSIPLRTYKRIENDPSYKESHKYKYAYEVLSSYDKKPLSITSSHKNDPSYKILVIGAGYVGFSIATLLSIDNEVSVIDINPTKVEKINKREPLFKDKEIEEYLGYKKLNLTGYLPDTDLYIDKDYIIISIPTDYIDKTNRLDTSNIKSLIKEIREYNSKALIVIKSTCNIGDTSSFINNDKNIIFSPEFLREGKALYDNLYPSRIIIGGDKHNKKVKEFATLLYKHALNKPKVLYMASIEAEAVKLFSNSYLALRVAYFNELDSFAIKFGVDSKNIVKGVSYDPRIGDYYNNPSFGYGGYCLPKDTLSLIHYMDDVTKDGLISSIDRSNNKRKEFIVNDIVTRLSHISSPIVGVYSIESKKDSDNKRHASILDIIKGLEANGISIIYYDSSKMSLDEFKAKSDIVLVNRFFKELGDITDKVYTRDIFYRD